MQQVSRISCYVSACLAVFSEPFSVLGKARVCFSLAATLAMWHTVYMYIDLYFDGFNAGGNR